jgi:hypothetical protein
VLLLILLPRSSAFLSGLLLRWRLLDPKKTQIPSMHLNSRRGRPLSGTVWLLQLLRVGGLGIGSSRRRHLGCAFLLQVSRMQLEEMRLANPIDWIFLLRTIVSDTHRDFDLMPFGLRGGWF